MTKADNRASLDPDPFAEPFWTLAMAAAWAIWRNADKVREVAQFQTARLLDTVNDRVRPDDAISPEKNQVGEFEERPHTGSLFDVLNEAAREPADQVLHSKEARVALWAALQSGELPAWGIPNDLADRVEILKHTWIELTYFEPSAGGGDAIGNNYREVRYLAVRVRSEDPLRIWPAWTPRRRPRSSPTFLSSIPKFRKYQRRFGRTENFRPVYLTVTIALSKPSRNAAKPRRRQKRSIAPLSWPIADNNGLSEIVHLFCAFIGLSPSQPSTLRHSAYRRRNFVSPEISDYPSGIMTPAEAARYLRLAVTTLAKARCWGGGPVFLRLGRRIGYNRSDLDAWLSVRRAKSTSDAARLPSKVADITA